MAFPTSPANNQTALVNGIVYQWNSTLGVWKRNGSVNSIQVGQLLLNSAQQTTSNESGTLIVSGGAGITGNVYTGGVFITGAANGITFVDGTVQTTAPTNIDVYARTTVNTVSTLAQASFNAANTKLSSSGGTITGSLAVSQDLTVSGNLTVLGNSTTLTTNTLELDDSLIYLAGNNYFSDAVDIGIIAHYNDGANAHTGIFRDAILKEWIFFEGYTPEIESNNLINIAHSSFAYANVYAEHFKGNVVFPDGTKQSTAGSSAATSQAAFDQANAANQYANSAFAKANTVANDLSNFTSLFSGIEATQNTLINSVNSFAQGAYDKANSANVLAQASFNTANTSLSSIGLAYDKANSSNVLAQAAFDKANSAAEAANAAGSVLTSTVDSFTGDGTETEFTLSVEPATINYTTAVVGGVTQPKSAYSIVGTILTFTSAPANNQIVEITTLGTSNTTLYTVTTNVISPFLLMGA